MSKNKYSKNRAELLVRCQEIGLSEQGYRSRFRKFRREGLSEQEAQEKSLSFPPDHEKQAKRSRSTLYGLNRGKLRQLALPMELDEKMNRLIEQSGKTQSDFLAEIIVDWLADK